MAAKQEPRSKYVNSPAGAMLDARRLRSTAAENATLDRLRAPRRNQDLTVISGGLVLPVDPNGWHGVSDVLIRGDEIIEVRPHLPDSGLDVHRITVDATGMIVMPGLVECHLHAWLGQLRGIAPTIDFDAYMSLTSHRLAHHYRPHDMYVGTLLSSLIALDGGVTTVIDNSHNSRTPEHSNAAVEALIDSGIRGVHASGRPASGPTDNKQWPNDVLRLRSEYFASDDQLVTLRLFDGFPDQHLWRFARDNGLWMSHEMGGGSYVDRLVEFSNAGLLNHMHTFNHCFGTGDVGFSVIADAGAAVNIDPRSDASFGLGPAFPPFADALRHGIRPGLSMDNEISYGMDMFVEMQTLLYLSRSHVFAKNLANPEELAQQLALADIIEFATKSGAANADLADKVGTLSPGKKADIILLDGGAINMAPINDIYASVVGFANRSNVDTVLVGGQARKWRGKLVDVDVASVQTAARASRDYLLEAAGTHWDSYEAR